METDPDKPSDSFPDPIPELTAKDFDELITQDRYSGSLHLRDTQLLDVAPRIAPLLAPLHRGMYRSIWQKYGSNNKLSRTLHLQLSKIVEQYVASIPTPSLLEETMLALDQAARIEMVCELRMTAFRQHQTGNLHFVDKIDPKPKKKKKEEYYYGR